MYSEEEIFWVYRDDVPYTRKANLPDHDFITDLQMRYPQSAFRIEKEVRIKQEIRSFAPLKQTI